MTRLPTAPIQFVVGFLLIVPIAPTARGSTDVGRGRRGPRHGAGPPRCAPVPLFNTLFGISTAPRSRFLASIDGATSITP